MDKILLFIKTPPPLTGATIMNSYVNDSSRIKELFAIKTIEIHYSSSIRLLGAFSLKKIFITISIFFQLLRQLIFWKPKLVYFQISPLGFAFLRDLVFISAIKLFRVKIVLHLHGKGIKESSKKGINKILYSIVFKNEFVICLDETLVSDIDTVYKGEPFIVPNAIKEEVYKFSEDSRNKHFTILFVSNLYVSKGVLVLFEILKELQNQNVDFRARIVGAEAELTRGDIYRLIEINYLQDKVAYLGALYNDKKMYEYYSSDVLVYPTLNDIWGLVILEAMQSAKPVIASNDGAISRIVENGVTGYILPKNDISGFVEKIIQLTRNPDLIKEMGAAGRRKFLNNYTLEKFEENMICVFNKTLMK